MIIIIFSNYQDEHAALVAQRITGNHGHDALILDISQLSQHMFVGAHYNTACNFTLKVPSGKVIDLMRDVQSFWWRRPQPIIVNPLIVQPHHRQFTFGEWDTALNGIWQSIAASVAGAADDSTHLWVNDIYKDRQAANKPYQLTVAKQIGLKIPETLITNDPSEVATFWKHHQGNVIFKSFSATLQAWRETRPLRREFLNVVETVKFAPVIFQEYVAPATDLRITIVGNEIFAAETAATNNQNSSYQFDWRMAPTSTRWRIHVLPQEVREQLLKLMSILGLEYGAIDMRLTSEGQYYFLEINTAGQFLFIEMETGLQIAEAVAKHLISGKKRQS